MAGFSRLAFVPEFNLNRRRIAALQRVAFNWSAAVEPKLTAHWKVETLDLERRAVRPARMPLNPESYMRCLIMFLLLLPSLVYAQSSGEEVGKSVVSENDVSLSLAGKTRALGVGDPVAFGGTLLTGDESANVDLFLDGSRLTLAPNAQVKVDRFVYQGGSGVGEASISLVKGALRFVSGSMASDAYRLRTGYASIGVRGTRFVLVHGASEGTTVIVEEGIVDFSNDNGASVEVTAGKFSRIAVRGGPPSDPADIGQAEAAAVANVNTAVAISAPPSVSVPSVVGGLAASAAEASAAAASAPASNSSSDFGGDGRY